MTRVRAHCPLSEIPDDWFETDTGPMFLEAWACPLTGCDLSGTAATTGVRAARPVVHARLQCPQPCLTQWWVDSGDGALSWSGSELVVDWPDDDTDEGLSDLPVFPPSVLSAYTQWPSEPMIAERVLDEIEAGRRVPGANSTPPAERHGADPESLIDFTRAEHQRYGSEPGGPPADR